MSTGMTAQSLRLVTQFTSYDCSSMDAAMPLRPRVACTAAVLTSPPPQYLLPPFALLHSISATLPACHNAQLRSSPRQARVQRHAMRKRNRGYFSLSCPAPEQTIACCAQQLTTPSTRRCPVPDILRRLKMPCS